MFEKLNLRSIGLGLFIGAVVFCIYEIWVLSNDEQDSSKHHHYATNLKLVNIFTRHGDRAPSDDLPKGDRHAEKLTFFWPNGLHNLTEVGEFRSFRIGLETRRHYRKFIDYNSTKILAFSSQTYRCQKTLELILRAFYNLETNKRINNLKSLNCTDVGENCTLSEGSGSPDEWRRVKIDIDSIPALAYEALDNCKYRLDHPSPVNLNFSASPAVRSLIGIEKLKSTIQQRYEMNFSQPVGELWSTIAAEMNLARTRTTAVYTSHYSDWVNEVVGKTSKGYEITLFDVLEEAAILANLDRVVDEALYVQIGPLITSLVESQAAALGRNMTAYSSRVGKYLNKKLIFYLTHDHMIQLMLNSLGLINVDELFEKRFEKYYNSRDEVEKVLAGLKMPSFGISLRFELWEIAAEDDSLSKFPFVQLSIYNQEDGRFEDVKYKRVEFGSACARMFKKKYPNATASELNHHYTFKGIPIDRKFSCPYSLLTNLTTAFIVDEYKLKQLCDN